MQQPVVQEMVLIENSARATHGTFNSAGGARAISHSRNPSSAKALPEPDVLYLEHFLSESSFLGRIRSLLFLSIEALNMIRAGEYKNCLGLKARAVQVGGSVNRAVDAECMRRGLVPHPWLLSSLSL